MAKIKTRHNFNLKVDKKDSWYWTILKKQYGTWKKAETIMQESVERINAIQKIC